MEKIIMPVKAKHFKDAKFDDNCGCGLANAAKEFFNVSRVGEGVDNLWIENDDKAKICYRHDYYGSSLFEIDEKAAIDAGYDETIIREIELMPV